MNAGTGNVIEVRLREISQLFNSMDPSPFVYRDLDAAAEEFIVGWARELPNKTEFELVIHLAIVPAADRSDGLEDAVQQYFASRAAAKDRELRRLLRLGWVSMVIGLVFLAICFGVAEVALRSTPTGWSEFVKLGLSIVGWVAMWRPLEIFLYDWWPILNDRRLRERLSRMKVSLRLPAA